MLESVNKVQDAIQLALAKAEKVRCTCAQGGNVSRWPIAFLSRYTGVRQWSVAVSIVC